jgi:hypothetical protein
VPTIDLTDEELAVLLAAARKALNDDPFPRSPRLNPLKSVLAKLDPSLPPFKPPPAAPTRSRGGRGARR